MSDLLPPQLQVPVPQLVAVHTHTHTVRTPCCTPSLPPSTPARELLQGPLIDKIEDCLGSTVLVFDVAQPALKLEGMPQNLLLVRKVSFVLVGKVGIIWSWGTRRERAGLAHKYSE